MLKRELLLLDMLKKKVLEEKFTFKSQKIIRERNRFYILMSLLDKDGYINKISTSKNERYYTLSDKGYLQACLKTTDLDCPKIYNNVISGFIHFTLE